MYAPLSCLCWCLRCDSRLCFPEPSFDAFLLFRFLLQSLAVACLCCIVSHRTKEPAYVYLNFNYSACLTLSVSLETSHFLLVFIRLSGVPLVTVDDLIAQENSEVPIGNEGLRFSFL